MTRWKPPFQPVNGLEARAFLPGTVKMRGYRRCQCKKRLLRLASTSASAHDAPCCLRDRKAAHHASASSLPMRPAPRSTLGSSSCARSLQSCFQDFAAEASSSPTGRNADAGMPLRRRSGVAPTRASAHSSLSSSRVKGVSRPPASSHSAILQHSIAIGSTSTPWRHVPITSRAASRGSRSARPPALARVDASREAILRAAATRNAPLPQAGSQIRRARRDRSGSFFEHAVSINGSRARSSTLSMRDGGV